MRESSATVSRTEAARATACRPLVLVVEDEVLIRTLLAETLRGEGYLVLQAANAAEALDVLEVAPDVDFLVTDVKMPGPVDGLQLAARVRQARRDVKVIVTSGHAEVPQGVADAFFPKPYDCGLLADRLSLLAAANEA